MKDEDEHLEPLKRQRKHPYAVISQVCDSLLLLLSSIMMAFTELERMSISSTHEMAMGGILNSAITPLVTHAKWPAGVVYMVTAVFLHYRNRHIPWRDHLLAVALVVSALSGLALGFDLETILFVPLQLGVMVCLCCTAAWSCHYYKYGPKPWWATAENHLHWEKHTGNTGELPSLAGWVSHVENAVACAHPSDDLTQKSFTNDGEAVSAEKRERATMIV